MGFCIWWIKKTIFWWLLLIFFISVAIFTILGVVISVWFMLYPIGVFFAIIILYVISWNLYDSAYIPFKKYIKNQKEEYEFAKKVNKNE